MGPPKAMRRMLVHVAAKCTVPVVYSTRTGHPNFFIYFHVTTKKELNNTVSKVRPILGNKSILQYSIWNVCSVLYL